MKAHEKGRITMNSNNKWLIFLGAYLSVGVMFLCFCRRFMTCFSGSCSGTKKG